MGESRARHTTTRGLKTALCGVYTRTHAFFANALYPRKGNFSGRRFQTVLLYLRVVLSLLTLYCAGSGRSAHACALLPSPLRPVAVATWVVTFVTDELDCSALGTSAKTVPHHSLRKQHTASGTTIIQSVSQCAARHQ